MKFYAVSTFLFMQLAAIVKGVGGLPDVFLEKFLEMCIAEGYVYTVAEIVKRIPPKLHPFLMMLKKVG